MILDKDPPNLAHLSKFHSLFLLLVFLKVGLCKHGKIKTLYVHRLVASAFIKHPIDLTVNHKNGIREDNRLENLEIISQRENVTHGYDRKGYVGASYFKPLKKWQSKITIGKDNVFLGYFETAEEANSAYKEAIIKYNLENKYA